ncbi:DUF1501 domain-containing protein [Paracoccus salsus]|uniref:DUF1501 domain-containing protein n=1 Tax=Paracoccus salsus TaxID=2911061 RepID=UPI001F215A2D|nr:DUF1501 domain-containing protein [Paracoccus salsus]MCF3972797.1 DUF1501 domain-containing protein [Paracoccus salsus]
MLSRRLFLKSSALIGCSAAAHPLLSSIALASAPGENRLVVIILRGAMDGLDVFQPYGDPHLRALRRTLSPGPDGGALDLDGFFALHPALAPLMPLWRAGELGFAPAVSTPYRDKRSHFDGQDMLEAGTGTDLALYQQRDGWLNRLLQTMPNISSETAYSVGLEKMRILGGPAPSKSWAPEAAFSLSPQAQRLLERVYHDDPLFREAGGQAMEIVSEGIGTIHEDGGPTRDTRALARFAADRLSAGTRIATFSISGWDSHARQSKVIGRALDRLSDAILTLREGLGRTWMKTTVLAMTEFGRTAAENGTGGTDHGTGGALLMAGGAVRGGRAMGRWPGLAEGDLYAGRDLMPVRDIRAYAAWALHDLYGVRREVLEGTVFPGLDMEDNPRILA